MSSSNSLAPMDPLLPFSLVVPERESENIAPQDVAPGRVKGRKREESGSAGGNGTSGTGRSEFIGRRTLSQHLEKESRDK